jgi:hypothetical protein
MDLLKSMQGVIDNFEKNNELIHRERFIRRTKQMEAYWRDNPQPVRIELPEDVRDQLKAVCTGKDKGTDWARLSQDERDAHTRMVTDMTWKIIYGHPYAFLPQQTNYYRKLYAKAQRA